MIFGPTAVGKTALSLQLASDLRTEIVNVDSRQIYREIPIGTAAPTKEEQQRIKHHFVGILGLEAYYSAAQFEKDALEVVQKCFIQHDTVIASGGSMLYLDALCKGIDDIPNVDDEVRQMLKKRYDNEGLNPLLAELRLLDKTYYDACDKRNHKRVIHALEICYQTGRPFSSFHRHTATERPFRIIKIGLRRERQELFDRINRRTDTMMGMGWEQEARNVYPLRHLNSLNTVGYKELFKYFDGEWTLDFALEKIQRNTRVYAKKQMTWFAHDAEINWFHPDQCDDIYLFLRNNGIDL